MTRPAAPIPVIDLFAGPGGLGEGFAAVRRRNQPVFRPALSIEMDPHAHQTLTLHAFYRQFPDRQAPTARHRPPTTNTPVNLRLSSAAANKARRD